jgi:glycosyltransferase involved in cell wall biosynthesis
MGQVAVTVVIPTLNEAGQIAEAVAALQWADEVIVSDGGSTDGTADIARAHGATVIAVVGQTIAAQRNAAIALARHAWVLALDADERVTEPLRQELAAVLAAPTRSAYAIRRENVYLGRKRRGSRGDHDWHVRLFPNTRRFVEVRVHEALEPVADVGRLRGTIHHVSYRDLTHHVEKITVYSRWAAADLYGRGRRATLFDLAARPAWRFLREYVMYANFLDGRPGLLVSALSAYAAFLKYAFLWELEEATDTAPGPHGPSPQR